MAVDVRILAEQDAASYQVLRLRSLREHPEAFGTSVEEEESIPLEQVARNLAAPGSVTFGAFDAGKLTGIANLYRFPRAKTRHRAIVGGMYVVPEARGQGAGQALMNATIDHARSWDGLEDMVLAVTVGNDTARRLYLNAGFTPYSVDPRFIKVGDQYFDIEWMILRIVDHG